MSSKYVADQTKLPSVELNLHVQVSVAQGVKKPVGTVAPRRNQFSAKTERILCQRVRKVDRYNVCEAP